MRVESKHIGESGKHEGHVLELHTLGEVWCADCSKQLTDSQANIAWTPSNQPVVAEAITEHRD